VQRTGRGWPLKCTYARAVHCAATWVGSWAGYTLAVSEEAAEQQHQRTALRAAADAGRWADFRFSVTAAPTASQS